MGYREIADELEREIASGALPLGSNVPSRREICERFGVSNVTAARVHDELSARNLVLKIRGSGVEVLGPFIPPALKAVYPKIRTLSFLHNVKSGALRATQGSISEYLKRESEKRGVEYRAEYGEMIPYAGVRKALKSQDPSHAYVISVQNAPPDKVPVSHLYLMNPNIQTVLLDGIAPQSYCVLADNYAGMAELVKYVSSRGCRSVLYVNHFYSLGNCNASERFHACRSACLAGGIKFRVIDSGGYKEILTLLASAGAPDAVMCSQDSVAVRLIRILDQEGFRKYPLITGFDGFSVIGSDPRIATIHVNRVKMAEIAVSVIFTKPLKPVIYDIFRVPGTLIPAQISN